jgi:hypothetical protein
MKMMVEHHDGKGNEVPVEIYVSDILNKHVTLKVGDSAPVYLSPDTAHEIGDVLVMMARKFEKGT